MEKTARKRIFGNSNLKVCKVWGHPSKFVYRTTLKTSKSVQSAWWKMSSQYFRTKINWSLKHCMQLRALGLTCNQVSTESKKLKVSLFKTFQILKIVHCCPKDEMQPATPDKIFSTTGKHREYP